MSLRGSGEPLVAIVRQLARTCGPQTFFADNDGIPLLIPSADATPIGPEPWYGTLPDFVLD
jgi:hypothetical protein